MKILITGVGGFVGRHFATRLLDDSHELTGVDDLSAGLHPMHWPIKPKRRSVHDVLFYKEDFRQFCRAPSCRADLFDLIIHCAAVVGGRVKMETEPLAIATDLAIDSDLFNWVAKAKRRPKIIYFSSSAVYPIELQTRRMHVVLSEDHLNLNATRWPVPDQTYGFAKLAGEFLAKQAVEKYGMDVIIYRPFSGYGEDQDVSYPFPAIVQRVKNHENPLVVWGSGDQIRDFIHIDDIVEAVLKTKDVLAPGSVLNLGTGISTSFRLLAKEAAYAEGYDRRGYVPEIVNDDTKPEGVFARVCDPTRMFEYHHPKIFLRDALFKILRVDRRRKAV